jgi:hypothetical protein
MIHEYFPEGLIALQKELATGLHPQLEKLLANHPANEWEIKIAEIATYCGVLLDDTYHKEDFNKLGFILAGRLEVLREIPKAQNIIAIQ